MPEIQDGGFKNCVTHASADTQDSNDISTAALNISGSGNTARSVGILSDVWECCKTKMAAINQK